MLHATPALEAPVFLSATSPESTMPKQLVLTEADLASRWAMSPKTLQRWRMSQRIMQPSSQPGDGFGASVAIHGPWIVAARTGDPEQPVQPGSCLVLSP